MLPTELVAMVFESLPPSSLAVCAQCSTRFSQLAQPLLWRTVYAHHVPLPVAKRIYATLRASPHLAAAVHHLDVTAVLRPGGAPMVVLDQLAVLPLLCHLRALSLHGAFRAQELLLLPPLTALQIRVTAQNAPFVARQTQLTALMHADAADAYDWDTAQLLGAGAVPLTAAALSMSVLVRMLACECEPETAPESEPRTHRRLATGCYIRLLAAPPPEPAPDFRTLCRVFEALPPASPARIGLLHVGALCDYRIRVPFKTAFATTRIDAVRLALPAPLARLPLRRVTVLHPRPTGAAAADECAECLSLDAILDLLRMCRGLHTVLVQRWPPAAPPLFDDLRIFADMLTQFSAVCSTLHTVVSPWGTKFAMLDGVWFDSGAFTPYEPDPFAAAAAVFGPPSTPTEQDTPAPPLPDGSSTQNVDAGIDCCWATPTSPPWRSARLS